MGETPADTVRRADPDRFLCALLAPARHRHALLTLYAFNHELARAREAASEPGLALIRLQWWREIVEGAVRAHEVAAPLRHALDTRLLHTNDLLAMIEAREQEADPAFADIDAWRTWLLEGAGSLAVAAGRLLGADPPALSRLRQLGAGYGAAGVLRSVAVMARQGRCLLPTETLADAGLDAPGVIAEPHGPAMVPVRARLARMGATLLGDARPMKRAILAAALPAVLARRDLENSADASLRGLGDRLAVITSWLQGRA